MQWYFPLIASSVFKYVPDSSWLCIACLLAASHYYLSSLYLFETGASVKQSPQFQFRSHYEPRTLPFVFSATGGEGGKTHCFVKTITVDLGQHPLASVLANCSHNALLIDSFRSVSMKVRVIFSTTAIALVQLLKKKSKRKCAAICFAINNGWVNTLFKLIKLLNSPTVKTFTCRERSSWTAHPVKIRYNKWRSWGGIKRKLTKNQINNPDYCSINYA